MLTEATLCVLGAGDLWVMGVTPLLRLLFGVEGPASWSLRSDEPVLPLNEKEYSGFNMLSSYHFPFFLKESLDSSPSVWLWVFVSELRPSIPALFPTAHQHSPSSRTASSLSSQPTTLMAPASASTSKAFADTLSTWYALFATPCLCKSSPSFKAWLKSSLPHQGFPDIYKPFQALLSSCWLTVLTQLCSPWLQNVLFGSPRDTHMCALVLLST